MKERKKTKDELLEENAMNEILRLSLESKDKRVKCDSNNTVDTDTMEDIALATAIRESTDIEAKRKMIDSLATKKSGGEIIPNNHEEDFELDDMALASLLDMGFEFGPAYIILKKCNNNHDIALTMLLNGEVT